ncbi:hypothetical protein ACP8HI_16810 [Paenibacillus sp. FA6]|uniref:hypothetical protein n=1 Tax=Paenibacillus sp. FA6 TaxID=3413029 RepID=UPI003F66020E
MFNLSWGTVDGCKWGTYLHGVFHNDAFRRSWLDGIRVEKGLKTLRNTYSSNVLKEQEFDRIAEVVHQHIDVKLSLSKYLVMCYYKKYRHSNLFV